MSNVSVSRRAGCAAARAGDVLPGRMVIQRIARPVERHVVGQFHRQLIVRHRHHAAGVAMDHRDRAAPVALPAHAPVAQPPVHLALADAEPLQLGDRRALRRVDVQAVHEARVEDRARPDIGLVADRERRRRPRPAAAPPASRPARICGRNPGRAGRAPGQPKIAPVPYSISTKLAIQTGKVASFRNGCRTRSPVS